MNILFISHGLYPCIIGGAEIFNYYLIKELSKLYKVYVLTCCKEKIDPDVTIIPVERRRFGPGRISIPLQDIINIARLRNKIDLVHVSYMRSKWIQWLPYPVGRKIFGVPYIFTIHDGMYKWKPRFPHEFLFKNAADIIAVSPILKKEYERRSGRDIRFIPPVIPFIECEEDKGELRNEYGFGWADTIILYLGSIKKIKGSDTLLTAFIRLGRRFVEEHKLRLLFVGDGNMREELEKVVKQEDFGMYVRFLGNVPREKVPAMFKIADIYVIPSLFEGTSISMLEAMFNKLPIIGSDTRGINNIIKHGENGLLFETSNSEDLRDKIMYLVENKDVAKKIADMAKKTYDENYNFEVVVKQYIEIYESLRGM